MKPHTFSRHRSIKCSNCLPTLSTSMVCAHGVLCCQGHIIMSMEKWSGKSAATCRGYHGCLRGCIGNIPIHDYMQGFAVTSKLSFIKLKGNWAFHFFRFGFLGFGILAGWRVWIGICWGWTIFRKKPLLRLDHKLLSCIKWKEFPILGLLGFWKGF